MKYINTFKELVQNKDNLLEDNIILFEDINIKNVYSDFGDKEELCSKLYSAINYIRVHRNILKYIDCIDCDIKEITVDICDIIIINSSEYSIEASTAYYGHNIEMLRNSISCTVISGISNIISPELFNLIAIYLISLRIKMEEIENDKIYKAEQDLIKSFTEE